MLRRHGLPALFALLIALHLVPIWTVRYEPTCDGPSHLYNAWVLQALVRGTAPPAVHDALAVRWALFPNWLAHVVLAVSIAAVGPLIAEKLLLSLLLAGLGAAAWILAGSGRPPDGGGPSDDSAAPVHVAAFFALPLLVSWPFLMGFHGFCAGLAIDLLLFAGFWRWRNAWTLRRACGMAALAVLAMLAHPVAIACGAAGLAVLFVADGETARRIGRRALAVLPFAVAGGAVLFVYRSTLRPWGWPLARKLTYLLTYRTLYTLDPRQVALGHAAAAIAGTAVVLAVLASRTTAPRAGAPFAWMAAALTACYLVTPDQGFGGSILGPRLALYPGLVLLPWLAARLPRRSVPWFAAAWTLWTLAELSILLPACRARDRELRAYLAPLETLPSGASVWIAPVDERPAPAKVPAFLHAAGYAAAERGLLLWPNYEVEMAFFPIARRSPTAPNVDSEAVVDYGYGWRLPPDSPARSRLDRELELVSTSDAGGSLYRRRAHQPRRGRDLDPTHAHQRPATGGVAGRHSR